MNIEELEQIAENAKQEHQKYDYEVNVCMAMGCMSQHSDKIKDELVKKAEASGKKVLVRSRRLPGTMRSGPAGSGRSARM